MNEKRVSVRAIILQNEKMVSMYREKNGRIYYTFPGGGLQENESEKECVIREVIEEFGMVVEPIKKVYTYESEKSIEHFYLCKHISGEFGSGQGEEFQDDRNKGVYKPMMIEISNIPNLPLMPPEVAEAFYQDYIKDNSDLRNDVEFLYSV